MCMPRGFDMPQTLFATASATPRLREANLPAASTMGFPKTLFATASATPGLREATCELLQRWAFQEHPPTADCGSRRMQCSSPLVREVRSCIRARE
jgi:hypothetical protein